MIIILGLDGLEYDYVMKFDCQNLFQQSFGRTDLSEFTELKTVILWSSFLAEKNMEQEINQKGELWDFKLPPARTFFANFKRWKAIDVPGLTYRDEEHRLERVKLKDFFDKKASLEEYDRVIFQNHQKNKTEFWSALEENHEILMGYFDLADAIGHLSFGITSKMKLIYQELDDLVGQVKTKFNGPLLIIADHGMKAVGRFGDHHGGGFWSMNSKLLPVSVRSRQPGAQPNPGITEIFKIFINENKT
ncbi:MAG: hypothetical protein AAB019_05675 [Planctomycetota bacterium]